MPQILVVMLYVLWIAAAPERLPRGPIDWQRLVAFLGVLAILVLTPALAARTMTRRLGQFNTWQGVRQFHWLTEACRIGIVVWFGVAVLCDTSWPAVVGRAIGRAGEAPYTLPGMLLGPLPALFAWIALWWAQYPMDRLAREQSLLGLLESDLPVHAPPRFRHFFQNNLRMQVLATAIPLLLIAAIRDAASLALCATPWFKHDHPAVATALSFGATFVVLLIAPEPLRRILRTHALTEPTLRARLDALCKLTRTRYRQVLLWKTDFALGNAAVMGVLPQIRYVLLSDLLLETMDDRQIEAVFAHELGHVVHRHALWFVVVIIALILAMSAGADISAMWLERLQLVDWVAASAAVVLGLFWLVLGIALFGVVSRRLERQADVYAARVMQQLLAPESSAVDPRIATVGYEGAEAVASALRRAAAINQMPVDGHSFRHGSIRSRIDFLRTLTADPADVRRFDQSMMLLYALVLLGLVISGGGVAWLWHA